MHEKELQLIDEIGILTATVERCTENCLPPEVAIAHAAARKIMGKMETLRNMLREPSGPLLVDYEKQFCTLCGAHLGRSS